MKVAIVDLDGTLFDTTKRFEMCLKEAGGMKLEELKGQQRRRFWECYQSEKYMNLDEPKHSVINFVKALKAKGYYIHIVSGRTEAQLRATLEQLTKHNIPYDNITVRRNGDFRKDHEFKGEIVNAYLKEGHEVIIVDDSESVRNLLPGKAYSPDNLPDPNSL